jgi:hypothetical protein
MRTYVFVCALAVVLSGCSAQKRRLLHGGHAHEESAATAPAPAMPLSSSMSTEYSSWFDYLNKTGHEDPMDFVLDSLGTVGPMDKYNVSELLYIVSNSQ